MDNIVVYTAITNSYDTLKSPPDFNGDAECVAFMDEVQPCNGWQIRPACSDFSDPCRNAKAHKILPHVYFPDKEYSLWIDGSVTIKFTFPISRLIRENLSECDLAVFRHPRRSCIYQEASICSALYKDDPALIGRQVQRYAAEQYPADNGLAECTVLLRRHTSRVIQFSEMWYDEITKYSRRDQLSFNYVAHRLDIPVAYFPGYLDASDLFQKDFPRHQRFCAK
jgi:hypothetical protein